MRTGRYWALAGCIACVAVAAGCGGPSDEELFQQAENLYKEGQLLEAIPLFKQFLLRRPNHSGGHLYLGMCYRLSDQWVAMAEGETRTALYFYRQDGQRSTIPGFSDEYFKARCYMELIKAWLIRYSTALEPGMPPDMIDTAVAGLENILAEAQREVPADSEIQAMAENMPELEANARDIMARRFPAYRSQRDWGGAAR